MRRRQRRRDGFQGYSASAAAAWDRVFGDQDSSPAPTEESPAENSHKSLTPMWMDVPPLPPSAFQLRDHQFYQDNPFRKQRRCEKACFCTKNCAARA